MKLRTLICSVVLIIALAACSKKDKSDANADPEKKHEENIVTLTKENLEHVEIKTEPVTLGSLAITLKAPGRVSENLEQNRKDREHTGRATD